jgi:hypothetical protein
VLQGAALCALGFVVSCVLVQCMLGNARLVLCTRQQLTATPCTAALGCAGHLLPQHVHMQHTPACRRCHSSWRCAGAPAAQLGAAECTAGIGHLSSTCSR